MYRNVFKYFFDSAGQEMIGTDWLDKKWKFFSSKKIFLYQRNKFYIVKEYL